MKSFAAIALAGVAIAAPTAKRQAVTDADILNYALTLEHLEDTFYRQGLANFTQAQFVAAGFADPFYANLMEISSDEKTHVSFLTAGLTAAGATPVAECTYDFGVTDPKSFVATASVLEGVGVSAYLGAAADIMSKTYLTDAGSILTVESRHSAYIRSELSESPFPSPFDIPLDLDQVYTLAAPFIVSCPTTNPTLPVKAFPYLTPSSGAAVKQGDIIDLTSAATLSGIVYAAFITITGPVFANATATSGTAFQVEVPAGNPLISGQNYVVLTKDCSGVTDDNTLAGPAAIEVTYTAAM